jgi:hypothetical protein
MGVINKDNFNNIKIAQALAPVAITGDTTSSAIDTLGYASCSCFVMFGADATPPDAATNLWDCYLTECDTSGGSYTTVDAADVIGSTTNAFGKVNSGTEDELTYGLGYKGSKRYLKIVINETGAVSTIASAFAVLGHPATAPVDNTVQGS